LSPNVLGLTQVWYNTDTGEIMETDVVLNDVDFKFTTNPQDTSGFGTSTSSFSSGKNNVFIENVLSHEFGHAYGLSHSGGLQSTMLYMESPEQAHLSCDEQIAIHALYPDTHAGNRGAITGQVVSDAGKGVLGAHVLAISRQRGTVLATGLTDSSGHFQINALEPGDYFLMVEPYFAGSSALPSYYSAMTAAVCSGSLDFGRTLLTDPASLQLSSIEVKEGSTANVPKFVAHCSSAGGAAITAISGTDSINHASMATLAPAIYDSARNSRGFGLADRLNGSNPSYYRLQKVSGHLEVHALSYSLYSPIHPQLELLDINGKTIAAAKSVASVYSGDSGFTNFDGALTADALEAGDYFLKITASTLDSTRYPAGPVALDTVPFVVVTGSVNESPPPLATDLSLNARCRMDEAFASYSSPGGDPPRQATSTNSTNGAGFCG
ncbi:carboxypeptidase regulatory-like domain-containing protein, partial [Bdellovibrionota bacterium FG-1]